MKIWVKTCMGGESENLLLKKIQHLLKYNKFTGSKSAIFTHAQAAPLHIYLRWLQRSNNKLHHFGNVRWYSCYSSYFQSLLTIWISVSNVYVHFEHIDSWCQVEQQIQSGAAFESSRLHADPQRHAHIRSGCMWNHLQLHQHFLYIQLLVQRKANQPRMGALIPAGLHTSV